MTRIIKRSSKNVVTLPLPVFSMTLPMMSGVSSTVVEDDTPGCCSERDDEVASPLNVVEVDALVAVVDVLDVVVCILVVVVTQDPHGPPQSTPVSP